MEGCDYIMYVIEDCTSRIADKEYLGYRRKGNNRKLPIFQRNGERLKYIEDCADQESIRSLFHFSFRCALYSHNKIVEVRKLKSNFQKIVSPRSFLEIFFKPQDIKSQMTKFNLRLDQSIILRYSLWKQWQKIS